MSSELVLGIYGALTATIVAAYNIRRDLRTSQPRIRVTAWVVVDTERKVLLLAVSFVNLGGKPVRIVNVGLADADRKQVLVEPGTGPRGPEKTPPFDETTLEPDGRAVAYFSYQVAKELAGGVEPRYVYYDDARGRHYRKVKPSNAPERELAQARNR